MKKVLVATVTASLILTLSACGEQTKADETAEPKQAVVEMTDENTFLMPVGTTYTEKNPRDGKEYDVTIDFTNEYVGTFSDTENGPKADHKAVEIDFTVTNNGEEPLTLPNDVFISLIDKYTSQEYSRTLTSADEATHPQMQTGEQVKPGETKTFTKVIELPLELSIYDCMVYLGATVGYVTWDVENSITGGE
ncbi:MAG: hypothetical protein ACRCWD_05100 [Culicoidibacterales bacterium]